MAKRVGNDSPSKDAQLMPKKDLLALLRVIRTAKSKLAEERGELGNRIARAVADKGYQVGPGNVLSKLEKWIANDDIGKAIAFVQFLDYGIDCLGIREMDLFGGEAGTADEAGEDEEAGNVRRLRRAAPSADHEVA